MKTTISAEFRMRGQNFDPDDLNSTVKIKPTHTWKVGDPIERSPVLRRKDSAWIIRINEMASLSVEDQFVKLIGILAPYEEQLISISQKLKLEIEFSFGIYIERNEAPSIYFDRDAVQKIAKYNAIIDLDIVYC